MKSRREKIEDKKKKWKVNKKEKYNVVCATFFDLLHPDDPERWNVGRFRLTH